MTHTFHIPVLGLAFSIDTPLKVAKFGITSVLSIVDDELVERMREYYMLKEKLPFNPITPSETDYRARRITAYLDLAFDLVNKQIERLKHADLATDEEMKQYFRMLPEESDLSKLYTNFMQTSDPIQKTNLEIKLRNRMKPGDIEVNIMSKVDKINRDKKGNVLAPEFSDALASLRGFALSKLPSSVIISAGMNPRLFSYLTEFNEFFPSKSVQASKKIILKVSDYRSALIQAKVLAKKGIWVSEYRIESGLNCGGHTFPTNGILMGPILEEFKTNRQQLAQELIPIYKQALQERQITISWEPQFKITAQGGIGTASEQRFMLEYYNLDRTGWGSPFLLVPDASTVDQETLKTLSKASPEDFYLSNASPLGVPFQNFRPSSAEKNRLDRIAKGRPGAPCTKKYLVSNTEFTDEPICTASREYQHKKIKELKTRNLSPEAYQKEFDVIVEKLCLCEGLASSAYLKYNIQKPKENKAVAICPGPNTVYFKGVFSLEEMVGHIYGRINLLAKVKRDNLFINELQLYINYIKHYVSENLHSMDHKKDKYISTFKSQLLEGIKYYENIAHEICSYSEKKVSDFMDQIKNMEHSISEIIYYETTSFNRAT